jgi:MFS family permease
MWAILALVLLADALDVIDSTVTNIAASTIARELHGGQGLIKWLGTAYMLAMGVLLMAGGRLGDKYGQRRLFLTGMAGFTVASAVAGLSPSPALLVVARVAQGAFGALLIPQGMAIMTKTFSRVMLTKALGLFGPLLGLATVGGPLLAGFIISADLFGLSWRPIFLINLVLGVIGLAVAVRIRPRRHQPRRGRQRQRLAELNTTARRQNRIGRRHLDLLPGGNVRPGTRHEDQPDRRPGPGRPQHPARHADAPPGTGRDSPLTRPPQPFRRCSSPGDRGTCAHPACISSPALPRHFRLPRFLLLSWRR